jgi:glycine dehydrogenase subunit 2
VTDDAGEPVDGPGGDDGTAPDESTTTGRSPATYDQARFVEDDDSYEPLLAEKRERTVSVEVPGLPEAVTREELTLPDVSEPELTRHYTRLSQSNYGVDTGPFPLGSCTMKYNPRFLEDLAGPGARVHPDRPDRSLQGLLELQCRLQDWLGRVGGMDAVTLQPPAGAAGEFAGVSVIAAYHETRGDDRTEVIVPESAHGTNFASAAMAGFDVVELPSGEDGRVDLDALDGALGEETAALMLTNPNTLGLFERDIETVAAAVHDAGGLLYYDGANLNALLGRARPGDMGFDVMHYNVHKTFATPHGGGGPGAGPVGVVEELAPYLPTPHVREREGRYERYEPERSIGRVHGFEGNWLVLLKTYGYLARLGDPGLADASAKAVLNANYLAEQVPLEVPYGPFHHEFVAAADGSAGEFARRMLDYGVHPPTTEWPELVEDALMTEPTEAESKASLDRLAAAVRAVADEDAETRSRAPERTAAGRVDQVGAARDPRLSWRDLE